MPNVMGREFPYTPEGMAAAQQYKQAIGMRDGGMMGFRPIGMQAGGIAEDDKAATMETYLSFQEALENKSSPTELNKFIYDNLSALKTMALGNSARAAQLADVMKQSGFEGYMRNIIQGAGQVSDEQVGNVGRMGFPAYSPQRSPPAQMQELPEDVGMAAQDYTQPQVSTFEPSENVGRMGGPLVATGMGARAAESMDDIGMNRGGLMSLRRR